MKYTLEERESCLILTIEGSISDDYLREVRNAFDHAISGEKDLIVDLSEVTFISSSGLGLLFNSNTRLKTKGLRIVLSGATD
ncbi:MAG TPA: STAS domain-containing protein, partial [Spirochaetota bacterium]